MNLNLTSEQVNSVIATDYETDRRPLTQEEEIFIKLYVETLNKKLSFEKAFLNGESDSHSSSRANEILEKPEIGRRVAELMQKSLDADVAKSPSMLLKYIERYLELDPANFYEDDGRVIPLSQLSPENRLLISNVNKVISPRTGQIVLTYALPDKIKLLDHLSKLVTFVAAVRNLTGNDSSNSADAEAKRNAIFSESVPDEASFSVLETKIEEAEIKEHKISKKKPKEGTSQNTP